MAFFVKITPPLTFSSSEPLAGFVVNVVSVVSRNCILPKNRYLFLPVRSPVFVLSKALFLPPQSPVAHPPIPLSSSQSPLPSSPIPVSVLFHHLKVLSHPPRSPRSPGFVLSNSRSRPLRPLPSSPSPLSSSEFRSRHLRVPFPSSSVLFHPLKVLSPPLPPSQRKQRNDPKPSRRSWLWVVPKWNMILSLEDLQNNPLNNVEYSQHSTT